MQKKRKRAESDAISKLSSKELHFHHLLSIGSAHMSELFIIFFDALPVVLTTMKFVKLKAPKLLKLLVQSCSHKANVFLEIRK